MGITNEPRDSASKKAFSNNPFELSTNNEAPVAQNSSISISNRSYRQVAKRHRTMDPFEVRIRFTQHLQHLNASVTSANKAAQYALKYRDMDEDLHNCILEQLERVCFFSPNIFW
jgi:CTD kinase subunit gamma